MANGNRDQIILFNQGKLILDFFIFILLRINYRGICEYATASTSSAAYVIGGNNSDGNSYMAVSTIAQYKNNQWLKIGDLNEKKYYHSAILYNGEYLIVGGSAAYLGERLVNLIKII